MSSSRGTDPIARLHDAILACDVPETVAEQKDALYQAAKQLATPIALEPTPLSAEQLGPEQHRPSQPSVQRWKMQPAASQAWQHAGRRSLNHLPNTDALRRRVDAVATLVNGVDESVFYTTFNRQRRLNLRHRLADR